MVQTSARWLQVSFRRACQQQQHSKQMGQQQHSKKLRQQQGECSTAQVEGSAMLGRLSVVHTSARWLHASFLRACRPVQVPESHQ